MDNTQFKKFYLYVVHVIISYIFASYLSCTPTDGVKIQNNKYFDGEELVTVYKISLQRCICECDAKKGRCHSLIYKRSFTSCRLNVKNATEMNELLDKPGSTYIEMDDDVSGCEVYTTLSIQNTDHSAVPFNQSACGKPPVKANATYMGNLYSNGSRIKYVCNAGFKQYPQTESVTVCLYNESWSDINFTCKPDTIKKPCKNNSECFEEASKCKEGQCDCIDEYSYSLTKYACVEEAPKCIGNATYSLTDYPRVPGQIGCEISLISYNVPDNNFQASSYYKSDHHCYPCRARLVSNEDDQTVNCTAWAPENKNASQYIQVFDGNIDNTNPVTRKLPCPIEAQYIRIIPQDEHEYKAIKFELIGCTLESADCDFKKNTCGWQHVNGSLDRWKLGRPNINQGGSDTDTTCRSDTNSLGATNDSCMYIESDNKTEGNASVFQTIKKSNASRCLSLWYAASAKFNGSLNIATIKCERSTENVTDISIVPDKTWKEKKVPVESGVYRIVIKGVWTMDNIGVLMINDVKLLENDCL